MGEEGEKMADGPWQCRIGVQWDGGDKSVVH